MRDGFYVDKESDTRYITEGVAYWFTAISGKDLITARLCAGVEIPYIGQRRHT